jgi:hypothetical protein
VIEQYDLKLDVAAEAYARVGIAVSDAFMSCWYTKYRYNLVRPLTYIQDVIDPDWNNPRVTDPLVTPPFPEYTSGHSVQSGAAAYVLTDLLGDLAFVPMTRTGHAAIRPAATTPLTKRPKKRLSPGCMGVFTFGQPLTKALLRAAVSGPKWSAACNSATNSAAMSGRTARPLLTGQVIMIVALKLPLAGRNCLELAQRIMNEQGFIQR